MDADSSRGKRRQTDEENWADDSKDRREKNRQAAQKCRQNKQKQLDELKQKNKELADENEQLSEDKKGLKKEAMKYMGLVQMHCQKGCKIPDEMIAIWKEWSSTIMDASSSDEDVSEANIPDDAEVTEEIYGPSRHLSNTPETSLHRHKTSLDDSGHQVEALFSGKPTALFSGKPLDASQVTKRRSNSSSNSLPAVPVSSQQLPLTSASSPKLIDPSSFLLPVSVPNLYPTSISTRSTKDVEMQMEIAATPARATNNTANVMSNTFSKTGSVPNFVKSSQNIMQLHNQHAFPATQRRLESGTQGQLYDNRSKSEENAVDQLTMEYQNGEEAEIRPLSNEDTSNQNCPPPHYFEESVKDYTYLEDLVRDISSNVNKETGDGGVQSPAVASNNVGSHAQSQSRSEPTVPIHTMAPALLSIAPEEMSASLQQQVQTSLNSLSNQATQPIAGAGVIYKLQNVTTMPQAEVHMKSTTRQIQLNTHGVQPMIARRHGVQPMIASRHGVQPVIASRHDVQPVIASRHDVQPVIASRHDVQPVIASRHDVHPVIASRHDVQPVIASRHDVQPVIASRHKVQPVIASRQVGPLGETLSAREMPPAIGQSVNMPQEMSTYKATVLSQEQLFILHAKQIAGKNPQSGCFTGIKPVLQQDVQQEKQVTWSSTTQRATSMSGNSESRIDYSDTVCLNQPGINISHSALQNVPQKTNQRTPNRDVPNTATPQSYASTSSQILQNTPSDQIKQPTFIQITNGVLSRRHNSRAVTATNDGYNNTTAGNRPSQQLASQKTIANNTNIGFIPFVGTANNVVYSSTPTPVNTMSPQFCPQVTCTSSINGHNRHATANNADYASTPAAWNISTEPGDQYPSQVPTTSASAGHQSTTNTSLPLKATAYRQELQIPKAVNLYPPNTQASGSVTDIADHAICTTSSETRLPPTNQFSDVNFLSQQGPSVASVDNLSMVNTPTVAYDYLISQPEDIDYLSESPQPFTSVQFVHTAESTPFYTSDNPGVGNSCQNIERPNVRLPSSCNINSISSAQIVNPADAHNTERDIALYTGVNASRGDGFHCVSNLQATPQHTSDQTRDINSNTLFDILNGLNHNGHV